MISIYSNTLGKEELAAVARVFKSKWLGMGKECQALEEELAVFWKAKRVLLTNNCTAGLFLALKAIGVKKGDQVIVSTINFVGCLGAIMDCGAIPKFADVDPETLNILPSEITRLKTKKTKAVMLLHYGGHPCQFDEVKKACGKNIAIVEDSANSVMSLYKGKYCGTLGDIGTYSFDAMKTLVMGDGGALTVNNEKYLKALLHLRYLGFPDKSTSGVDSMKKGSKRWWEYDLASFTGRYISNDVLGAVGREQLKKLPGFVQKRKKIWKAYQNGLKNISGLNLPPEPIKGSTSSYYMYWINAGKRRDDLANFLLKQGIYTTYRYFPLHKIPMLKSKVKLPNSQRVNEEVLNLPLHQNLNRHDVQKIIKEVKTFFSMS